MSGRRKPTSWARRLKASRLMSSRSKSVSTAVCVCAATRTISPGARHARLRSRMATAVVVVFPVPGAPGEAAPWYPGRQWLHLSDPQRGYCRHGAGGPPGMPDINHDAPHEAEGVAAPGEIVDQTSGRHGYPDC